MFPVGRGSSHTCIISVVFSTSECWDVFSANNAFFSGFTLQCCCLWCKGRLPIGNTCHCLKPWLTLCSMSEFLQNHRVMWDLPKPLSLTWVLSSGFGITSSSEGTKYLSFHHLHHSKMHVEPEKHSHTQLPAVQTKCSSTRTWSAIHADQSTAETSGLPRAWASPWLCMEKSLWPLIFPYVNEVRRSM